MDFWIGIRVWRSIGSMAHQFKKLAGRWIYNEGPLECSSFFPALAAEDLFCETASWTCGCGLWSGGAVDNSTVTPHSSRISPNTCFRRNLNNLVEWFWKEKLNNSSMKIESDGLSMCYGSCEFNSPQGLPVHHLCLTMSTTRFDKSFLIEVALLIESGLPRNTHLFKRHGGSWTDYITMFLLYPDTSLVWTLACAIQPTK